jgi:hypothetical protein
MTAPQLTVYTNGPTAVSGDKLNTFMQTCDNSTQMRGLIGVSGIGIYARGMASANDGLGGAFGWNATSSGPDDNLNTIVPFGAKIGAWVRVTIGPARLGSIAALQAETSARLPGNLVYVAGYYQTGDGGGGTFYLGPNATANGGTIINDASGRSWYRQTDGFQWSIRWFGAKLDGTTDDTAAWTNILRAARLAGNPAIYHPGGNSIYTGNLALVNDTIIGVGSYYAPPGGAITQDSLITFHGTNAGLILLNAASGGFTLEKLGFVGLPGTYSGQTGLLMSDSLRTGLSEGWPTLRDVLFSGFSTGISVGNKYQTGFMYNVYVADSVVIGYQNNGEDWFHHGLSCGSSSVIASTAQLLIGAFGGTAPANGCGTMQFIGGAFFGAVNTILIETSQENVFFGCEIQNAQNNGVLIGNGTLGSNNNKFIGCFLNGNNAAGGARNVNQTAFYDIQILSAARGTLILGCRFDDFGAGGPNGPCVSGSIAISLNCEGTTITGGNQFNMDMINSVGSPTFPEAIVLGTGVQLNALDHFTVSGNFRTYGEAGGSIYPVNQLPLDMVSLANPYTVTDSTICIQAGTAVLDAASGNLSTFLPNPEYAGRYMVFVEVTAAGGDTVGAATSGAFGGGHTNMTFTVDGAYAMLLSTGGTSWTVLATSGVTLS